MSKPTSDDKIAAPEVETSDNQSQNVDAKLESTADADKAADFLLNADGYGELTAEAEKRLKRKIDWFMIPMVCRYCLYENILLTDLVVSRCNPRCG